MCFLSSGVSSIHLGWGRYFSLRQCQGKRLHVSALHRSSAACKGLSSFSHSLCSASPMQKAPRCIRPHAVPFVVPLGCQRRNAAAQLQAPTHGQDRLVAPCRNIAQFGPFGAFWGLVGPAWGHGVCSCLPIATHSLYADLSKRLYIRIYMCIYVSLQ